MEENVETRKAAVRTAAATDFHDHATAAYEARKELGPEYERAVLDAFAASVTDSVNELVDARLAQHGVGGTPGRKPKGQQFDDSYLAVPVFSVILGIVATVGLTAGVNATSEIVFAMWLGIGIVNLAFARILRARGADERRQRRQRVGGREEAQ